MLPLALHLPYLPGPDWLHELLLKFALAALLFLPFVTLVAMFSIWLERKVAGRIQSRHGPMHTGGYHGWLQSLADGIKLLLKEDLLPAGADSFLFRLAPYLAFAPALAAFLFLAWSRDLSGLTSTFNVGVFFLLATLGIEVLGVILAGYSSNNKWSVYGAMREACQMVSYEIPLGLSILTAIMVAGSLNLYTISLQQSAGPHKWLLFHDPFNMLAFVLYYIAALAACKRAPFDLPESESELVAGYHTEYSGMRFSFFFFAEYAAMFVVSGIQISLWLGALYDPFNLVAHLESLRFNSDLLGGGINWKFMFLANALGATVFITKAFLLIFIQIWLRWTLPRLRIDQVLHLCIKVLLPLACANLLAAATYLWLTEPLPNFQLIMQITLLILGILLVLAIFTLIAFAWIRRDKSTFKVIFPSSRPLPNLPRRIKTPIFTCQLFTLTRYAPRYITVRLGKREIDTRDEIKNNGLLAKIIGDVVPPASGQQFLSFYSIEGADTTLASQPDVIFTVPEPASLSMLGIAAAALLVRHKRKDA